MFCVAQLIQQANMVLHVIFIGQCASRGEMSAGTERVSPVRVCILLYSVVNMEVQLKSSSKFPELVNHSVKAV